MGSPLLVVCEAAGGHEAVELVHDIPCEDSDLAFSIRESSDSHEAVQMSTEQCVDTPLTPPPVLRQDDRPAFSSIPVVFAYVSTFDVAELPRRCPHAPRHVFSPDSPESLARSVILLI